MTTHLYTHDIFAEHDTPAGHPERADRIRAVSRALEDERFERLVRFETEAADPDVFALAHPADHIAHLKRERPEAGERNRLDPDTYMSAATWDCMLHACGGLIAAVDAVADEEADNAFVAARPPGHHAERTTAMGFCFVNNVAIAARYAQQRHKMERVAIVDFDVHHGNGTQDIFEKDPSVFYASTHQMPLFPGTGAKGERGVGNICNAPLAPGDGSATFREAFIERVLAELDAFGPDMIFVSAGFDAHHLDPLANIRLTEDDFDWATGRLMAAAEKHCDNRLVSVLEGGYDLEGLAKSCAAHVNRMMTG